MTISIQVVRLHPCAVIPSYATEGSVGLDLYSVQTLALSPGTLHLFPVGLIVILPANHEGQVRPRSGLARKGITLVNSPGTIDSDYRGEVKVMLRNDGAETYTVCEGDRIAQLVVAPVERAVIMEIARDQLPPTVRGGGGFGSTGR